MSSPQGGCIAEALDAAGAALGGVVPRATGPPLRGGEDAVVVRAVGLAGTVVVKAAGPGERWVREAGALTLLRGRGVAAPELLAVAAAPLIVMADAGRGPDLADALLGSDRTPPRAPSPRGSTRSRASSAPRCAGRRRSAPPPPRSPVRCRSTPIPRPGSWPTAPGRSRTCSRGSG
ncbi:hypothetical protein [Pseudonocardia sp. GCM10023141]|uniref:hypothetical protein n=1 Tax=Pseudonocardia sp. GCM10023141 TaxID=3252653 RepID=UPI003608BCA2